MKLLTPHTRNAGYFLNNQALATAKRDEGDVQTCAHCECVIIMQKWKDDGAFCGRCMKPICARCGDRMLTHGCEPFIKSLERAIEMTVKLAQHRKVAGLDAPPADYTPRIQVGASYRRRASDEHLQR